MIAGTSSGSVPVLSPFPGEVPPKTNRDAVNYQFVNISYKRDYLNLMYIRVEIFLFKMNLSLHITYKI